YVWRKRKRAKRKKNENEIFDINWLVHTSFLSLFLSFVRQAIVPCWMSQGAAVSSPPLGDLGERPSLRWGRQDCLPHDGLVLRFVIIRVIRVWKAMRGRPALPTPKAFASPALRAKFRGLIMAYRFPSVRCFFSICFSRTRGSSRSPGARRGK